MAKKKSYGWVPDVPDLRDKPQFIKLPPKLPRLIDLAPAFPPILDQQDLGSCPANAAANAHYFDQRRQKLAAPFLPSRLFTYYETRRKESSIAYDSGCTIRGTFKTMAAQGACPESMWPYAIAKFAEEPPRPCYAEALKHQAILYRRIPQDLGQMKAVLAAGYPFVFGFSVYTGFETSQVARTGKVQMPSRAERVLGGHAVCAVGYDDTVNRFKVANSWGVGWGARGYFTMPYAYLQSDNLAADFWVCKIVEG